MKLVIDIDEDDFLDCIDCFKEGDATWAEAVIANGIPIQTTIDEEDGEKEKDNDMTKE